MRKPERDEAESGPAADVGEPGSVQEGSTIDWVDDTVGALPAPGDDEVTSRIELAPSQHDAEATTGVDPIDFPEPTQPIDHTQPTEATEHAEPTDAVDQVGPTEAHAHVDGSRLESILESLLFAADRPLALGELKRLLGERDGKRITEALGALGARRADSGIQLMSVAGGWQLRTHPGNGAWVSKLVAGRPTRLSRAMMETLAIVAYRQPITRPEIDEIRGVDCGPVLRTLLDRALIRVLGKKEEVGRPMLYGTTPEFLKIFSLRDLAELPTLREFHELGADDRAKVDATATTLDGAMPTVGAADLLTGVAAAASSLSGAPPLSDVDPAEEDALLEALETAAEAAGRAGRSFTASNDSESGAPDAEDEPVAPAPPSDARHQ